MKNLKWIWVASITLLFQCPSIGICIEGFEITAFYKPWWKSTINWIERRSSLGILYGQESFYTKFWCRSLARLIDFINDDRRIKCRNYWLEREIRSIDCMLLFRSSIFGERKIHQRHELFQVYHVLLVFLAHFLIVQLWNAFWRIFRFSNAYQMDVLHFFVKKSDRANIRLSANCQIILDKLIAENCFMTTNRLTEYRVVTSYLKSQEKIDNTNQFQLLTVTVKLLNHFHRGCFWYKFYSFLFETTRNISI